MEIIIKILKKTIVLFNILVFSIYSFAAVVSDNDGSAFITKAEYDSLKNNFQNQLNQYYSSIDSKIDNAIASYLSGIITTTRYELHSNINTLKDELRTFIRCNDTTGLVTGDTFRFNGAMWLASAFTPLSGNYKDSTQGMVRASLIAGNPNNTKLTFRTIDNGNSDYKVMLEEKTYDGKKYYYPYYTYRLKIEHWMGITSVMSARAYASVDPTPTATSFTWTSDVTEPGTALIDYEWTPFHNASANPQVVMTHTSNERNAMAIHGPFKFLLGYATDALLETDTYGIIYTNKDLYDDSAYASETWSDGDNSVFIYKPDAVAVNNNYTVSNTLKYKVQKLYTVKYKDFINEQLSDRMNQPITRCDGLPICSTSERGKVKIKLDLESLPCDSSGSVDVSSMTYIVEVKGSKWGTVSPTTTKQTDSFFYKNDVSEGELEINIDKDNSSSTTYWLKIVPSVHYGGVKVTFKEASIEVER
ncbi:MAG: hypothetical protein J6P02_05250 [Lachnospiraceae bacterium]|nr:hypothetical protein [Lachnospiraceae bacterium]